MLRYLVPRFPISDLPVMLAYSAAGSLVAGVYGIVHDQITFTIGPEYFTNFKFFQFKWANLGFGDRFFVACIGFLATWWVGLITSWILCRRMLPNQERAVAHRKIRKGIAIVFATAILFGATGYIIAWWLGPSADYSAWEPIFRKLYITDKWGFVCVGYIHNAGYLGGLTGIVLTYFFIRKDRAAEEVEQGKAA